MVLIFQLSYKSYAEFNVTWHVLNEWWILKDNPMDGSLPGIVLWPNKGNFLGALNKRYITINLQMHNLCIYTVILKPIPVATRSKAWVCGSSLAGIARSNPNGEWMSASCDCCVLSGRGLCVGLITRPEQSYRVWCVLVWSWSKTVRRAWPTGVCCVMEKEKHYITTLKTSAYFHPHWEDHQRVRTPGDLL
jgi:hypothetical protein